MTLFNVGESLTLIVCAGRDLLRSLTTVKKISGRAVSDPPSLHKIIAANATTKHYR